MPSESGVLILGLKNLKRKRQCDICRYQTVALDAIAPGWRRYTTAARGESAAVVLSFDFLTPRHQCEIIGAVLFSSNKREFRMFFKKKQKVPLENAIALVHQAIAIAYTYKRDKSYQPSEADLALFQQLSEALYSNRATAQYIARCMGQRFRLEPEGAKKFTDPDVFDTHYPP